MKYSLYFLNKLINFNSLTFLNFIDRLNNIGFEVDEIKIEESINFEKDIKLLLKIPANRTDLENINIFLTELSTIFIFDLVQFWEKIKTNYSFLIFEKYKSLKIYSSVSLVSDIEDLGVILIPIKNFQNFNYSPKWIKEKLKTDEIEIKNSIFDVISYGNKEWNQFSNLISFSDENFFSISKFSKINSIEGIYLRDNLEYSKDLLVFDKNQEYKSKNKLFLSFVFFDSYENKNYDRQLLKKVSSFKKAGFQRIITLLEILFSVEFLPKIYSSFPKKIILKEKKIIKLRKKSSKLFLNIDNYNLEIFKNNGFLLICETKTDLYFSINIYRKDLLREIDLIEEYSKFIGYKNFQEIFPRIEKSKSLFLNFKKVKEFFLLNGFNEVLTNPIQFNKENYKDNKVCLINPLIFESNQLRSELLPKLLEVFELNSRNGFERRNFFEIGRIFLKKNNQIFEQDHIAGIFELNRFKKLKEPTLDWFIAKGFLEKLLTFFGSKNFIFSQMEKCSDIFYPTRSLDIKVNHEILGKFGELNPKFEYNSKYPIYIFELNLNLFKTKNQFRSIKNYYDYSKYPSIIKDLSFSISKEIKFDILKLKIKETSNYLQRIEIFDVYFENFNPNLVNIGIRLEFQSFSNTLTNNIIDLEIDKIQKILVSTFNIKFRN